MTRAFGGDAAVKAALLDRLDHHAARGTLRFGATAWDGQGGTPLGVSIEGGDSADYAARYGYPIALAGLLDPMTAYAAPDRAADVARDWVRCVAVGADLSGVPQRIAEHILRLSGADWLATPYVAELRTLHRAEGQAAPPPRAAWSELRERIEQAADAAPPRSDTQAALKACATACWPLQTSRSVLATLLSGWVQDANHAPDPEFPDDERARAMAMLEGIYRETQPARDAGSAIDIPALFRARAPDLAQVFEAGLARANARHLARARAVPDMVLAHLATAPHEFE